MAVDYEKQIDELYRLYAEDAKAQCAEQAQRDLQDLAMPVHLHAWTLAFVAATEQYWDESEVKC